MYAINLSWDNQSLIQEVKHYLKQIQTFPFLSAQGSLCSSGIQDNPTCLSRGESRGDRQQLTLAFCNARGHVTVKQLERSHLRFLLEDPSLGARAERDKVASSHLLDKEEELTHGFPAVPGRSFSSYEAGLGKWREKTLSSACSPYCS